MNEHSLHAAIKGWYSLPGDRFESRIGDFVVDIARGGLLIEIQTKNFSAIKKKIASLVRNHKVRLVYPIAKLKWIVRTSESGEILRRRRSPKKGKLVDLFDELVSLPEIIRDGNFSLEILMIEEEELRCNDGKGSWRRRGVSIKDRKLIKVIDRKVFHDEGDFLIFLPGNLGELFTNKDLAKNSGLPTYMARKITYCLRKMGAIVKSGKKGRQLLFKPTLLMENRKNVTRGYD